MKTIAPIWRKISPLTKKTIGLLLLLLAPLVGHTSPEDIQPGLYQNINDPSQTLLIEKVADEKSYILSHYQLSVLFQTPDSNGKTSFPIEISEPSYIGTDPDLAAIDRRQSMAHIFVGSTQHQCILNQTQQIKINEHFLAIQKLDDEGTIQMKLWQSSSDPCKNQVRQKAITVDYVRVTN